MQPDGAPRAAYAISILALEVEGRTTWGAPAPDAGPPSKLIGFGATVSTADPTGKVKPDFIDSPSPPNCYAHAWKEGSVPNRTAGDAGKITIKGHLQAQYVDGENPGTPTELPAQLECTRKPVGDSGLFEYDCGLPRTPILVGGSWMDDTTTLDISASGGPDIAAFAETGLKPSAIVTPAAGTDLAQLDPEQGITLTWDAPGAQLVVIFIKGSLADGSEFADITCTAVAASGSKTIPPGALALLPKPTATAPLILRTSLVSVTPKGATTKWGYYLMGAGRGTFGVSCRTPTGPCP